MQKNSVAEEAKKHGPVYEVKAINKSGETYTLAPIVTKELGFDYVMDELKYTVGFQEGDIVISARLINDGDFLAYNVDAIARFFSIKALADTGTKILDNARGVSIASLYNAMELCDQLKNHVDDVTSIVWVMIEEKENSGDAKKEEKKAA